MIFHGTFIVSLCFKLKIYWLAHMAVRTYEYNVIWFVCVLCGKVWDIRQVFHVCRTVAPPFVEWQNGEKSICELCREQCYVDICQIHTQTHPETQTKLTRTSCSVQLRKPKYLYTNSESLITHASLLFSTTHKSTSI